jgi:hypothetical protein
MVLKVEAHLLASKRQEDAQMRIDPVPCFPVRYAGPTLF